MSPGAESAAAYFAADRELVIPASTASGSVAMASMLYTAFPFAVLVAVSLHSSMASLEQAATAVLRRAELVHLAFLTVLSCTLFAAATYAGGSHVTAGTLAEAVRNVLLFLGLGLISARLFGRALAWGLPLADFVVVGYWGAHGGGVPRWWAWQFHSYASSIAWIGTLIMLAAGVAALWFLPRRRAFPV
ncbi:hypothetical protein HNP84_004908 [Thermocatellispora tengchongensis]|uniref:Uncharacterized protein n=1 Tax=Thermocatellispora tengchongensis TaxID=1073253 RepID=A0A840P779_9ACTN|nr:hypothetical protein [Thermocatellispora tengchongensis]MBB5135172.1 hypothetical protein [Thermocatellispora tengchongensis]